MAEPLSKLEIERLERINENKRRMQEIGLGEVVAAVRASQAQPAPSQSGPKRKRVYERIIVSEEDLRRSDRQVRRTRHLAAVATATAAPRLGSRSAALWQACPSAASIMYLQVQKGRQLQRAAVLQASRSSAAGPPQAAVCRLRGGRETAVLPLSAGTFCLLWQASHILSRKYEV